jgi:hypothetical protein
MKEKYLVCEILDNCVLGGSVYNTEEDAQAAFCSLIEEYGVSPHDEIVKLGVFKSEDGFVVQMLKVLDTE